MISVDKVNRWPWIRPNPLGDRAVSSIGELTSFCKEVGFVFPREIYAGLSSTYDYGHYGSLLKEKIKTHWRKTMVELRPDTVALDAAIIVHPRTWETSGQGERFADPDGAVPGQM